MSGSMVGRNIEKTRQESSGEKKKKNQVNEHPPLMFLDTKKPEVAYMRHDRKVSLFYFV